MARKKPNRKYRYPGIRPKDKPNTYTIDYRDHNRKRHQITFHGSESDAAKYRRAILVKVDRITAGLEKPPEDDKQRVDLNTLWNAFTKDRILKIQAGSMSPRTLERSRNSYEALLHFKPSLVNCRLDKFTNSDFEEFKIHRLERGLSPEGVNVDLRKLRTLFNFAVKKRYLESSPLVDVAQVNVPKRDVRFLNEDELQSLDAAIAQLDLSDQFQKDARDLTIFYLFTGARLSEALYPTFDWSCICKNTLQFPTTKFSKSRTIRKPDIIADILKSRKHLTEGPFRFTKDHVYTRVKWLLRRASIYDASPHTLRKTAGAWFYMATRDIFAASRFLGHSSVAVTEQHYIGLIQSLEVEYMTQFEGALKAKLPIGCHFQTKQDQTRLIES